MREYKFRQALISLGTFCGWHYWGFIDGKFVSPAESMESSVSNALKHSQQFTGLEDKNDKEIYEGDILATANQDPQYDIWDKDEHGYTVVEWAPKLDGWFGSRWVWSHDDESIYSLQFCAVIGNIYENPDLVKP